MLRVAKRSRPRSTRGAAVAPRGVASGSRHAGTGSVNPVGPDLSWCTLQVTLQLGQSVRWGGQASPRTTARGVQRPCTSRSRPGRFRLLCHQRAMLLVQRCFHLTSFITLLGRFAWSDVVFGWSRDGESNPGPAHYELATHRCSHRRLPRSDLHVCLLTPAAGQTGAWLLTRCCQRSPIHQCVDVVAQESERLRDGSCDCVPAGCAIAGSVMFGRCTSQAGH